MTTGPSRDSGVDPPPISIPYGRQEIDESDIEAVLAVLHSDWLTQGPTVAAFEKRLCEETGARHSVAFSSGTAALHAACAAAGFSVGDRIATSTLSFVASANCIRFVGAEPVLVDIDRTTLNLATSQVPAGLAGMIAVHYAGLPIDLAAIVDKPPIVIEDAAHALGATTPDGPVGNCSRSDMCCFSFHPVKAITTAEGGAVTTNDSDLAERLRRFRNHGIVPTPERGGWTYDISTLGWNYRLTDLQAALGTSQLGRLRAFVKRRAELAERYRHRLAHLPIVLPPEAPDGWGHAYHLFPIQVDNRRAVYDGLRAAGIGTQVHYIPIHRLGLYRDTDEGGGYPVADTVYDRLLTLPLFPGLTESEQDVVVATLEDLL